jgi:hypothetical protein
MVTEGQNTEAFHPFHGLQDDAMSPLVFTVTAVFGTGIALATGQQWERAVLGGLFGLLVAAMLTQRSAKDWLFPEADDEAGEA